MSQSSLLLKPYQLTSEIQLKNRIVMAPMTRNMANDDLSPTEAMQQYYQRRAHAGLIITEGTIIRRDSMVYTNVPGIFNKAQIAGWRRVTDSVHQQDGKIFLQIWHVGRVSHPHFLNGELPIAPSATQMSGRVPRAQGLYFGASRAVSIAEIHELIESFAVAAENAIRAGFDGVEIHGANGYIIDQFLHYHTNQRQDAYGGTPERMARFALEVVKACGERIGYGRVGLRLSPGAYLNEIVGDVRDQFAFQHLLTQLNDLPIAYVHTGNFDDGVLFPELGELSMTQFIRAFYQDNVIACGSYQIVEAENAIKQQHFDLIAFGRPFIANPDLITRLHQQQPLREYANTMLETLY